MRIKIYKPFLIIAILLAIMTVGSSINAEEILPAEVYPSPSEIEAGKSDVIIYLLGLNSQLFSHSSSREPIVESDTGVTIKEFRVLSPKRAQLIINTATNTVGAIRHTLKFFDPEGENVVKTCVFYINVLGKATVSDVDIKMYTIPEIQPNYETIQRTGSVELEGIFAGRIVLTLPTSVKFKPGVPPQITSLSVDSSVYNIEVDESGDDVEFAVDNPQENKIKLFITNLYIDTSGLSGTSLSGNINLTVTANSFSAPVDVPVGHTPGYSVRADENLTPDDESSSNTSSSTSKSTSGSGYSYNGSSNTSSNTNNQASDATESSRRYGNNITRYSSSYRRDYSDHNSGYRSSRYNNYNGRGSYQQPKVRYNSNQRNARPQARGVAKKPTPKNNTKPKIDTVEKIKEHVKITPTKTEFFEVLSITLCNTNFDKKAAIPLNATESGFEASMNFEIFVDSSSTLPEELEVNITIGKKFSKTIKLKKFNKGVYRSSEVQKFSIAYDELTSE